PTPRRAQRVPQRSSTLGAALLSQLLLSRPHCSCAPLAPHSFPTRRSSDLRNQATPGVWPASRAALRGASPPALRHRPRALRGRRDRKSTRLNSSHVSISYAVICLKKKIKGRRRGVRLSPPGQ